MKKTVLITGASAGFGAACARKYRGQDYRLVLAARRLGRLDIPVVAEKSVVMRRPVPRGARVDADDRRR